MMENLSFSVEAGISFRSSGERLWQKHDFPFNQRIGAAAGGRDFGERETHP